MNNLTKSEQPDTPPKPTNHTKPSDSQMAEEYTPLVFFCG
jgi:hypothetical protein